MRYTLQSSPVIVAIGRVLARTPPSQLLQHIASWCSLPPHDWRVVGFQARSSAALLWNQKTFAEFYRKSPQQAWNKIQLYYDTPARAACAGFWHLHVGAAKEASTAFAQVRSLPHGEELYHNAQAFAAALDCQSLEQLAAWQPTERSDNADGLLRPQVYILFSELGKIGAEIATVLILSQLDNVTAP